MLPQSRNSASFAQICTENKTFTLWGISKEELEESFTVFYDRTNRLKRITANVKDKEALLYIRYDDIEDAKQEIMTADTRPSSRMQ